MPPHFCFALGSLLRLVHSLTSQHADAHLLQLENVQMTELVQMQRQRLQTAMERAQSKLVGLRPNPDANRLLNLARTASKTSQRVMWLQQAASAWAMPLETVAACQQGCDHCCHQSVLLTQAEAQLIGKAIGRKPEMPKTFVKIDELPMEEQAWLDAQTQLRASVPKGPCPFLVNHACGIHSRRPTACRLLLNLDNDDLLCHQVEGVEVLVPYANSTEMKAFYVAFQPAGVLADIREFFPVMESPDRTGKSAGA
jgi:Fe-S-cluster containining protein